MLDRLAVCIPNKIAIFDGNYGGNEELLVAWLDTVALTYLRPHCAYAVAGQGQERRGCGQRDAPDVGPRALREARQAARRGPAGAGGGANARLAAMKHCLHGATKKVIKSSKEEFQAANEGAAGPAGSARAFLKARTSKMALETSVGTVKVVKTDDASKSGGYYCEVCECGLKDSVAYLDHINGKKRAWLVSWLLGCSKEVIGRWLIVCLLRAQICASSATACAWSARPWTSSDSRVIVLLRTDYEKKLKAAEEEEARVKRHKKEQKKAKKLGKSTPEDQPATPQDGNAADKKPEAAEEEGATDADAEMMAMMGFGGFGGSKNSSDGALRPPRRGVSASRAALQPARAAAGDETRGVVIVATALIAGGASTCDVQQSNRSYTTYRNLPTLLTHRGGESLLYAMAMSETQQVNR
ncbi:hypothetical protein ON010_g7546 [Phytophthora cinnamomi]|nr:hypothetical protein ON010_g7546 [Phytophthora cinnamomi]